MVRPTLYHLRLGGLEPSDVRRRSSGKLEPVNVERRLDELGLVLPAPTVFPAGVETPFAWARVHGDRAFVSRYSALDAGGTPAGAFGKIPSEISLNDAQRSVRLATLAVLSSLKTALGDLDRVSGLALLGETWKRGIGLRQSARPETSESSPCSSGSPWYSLRRGPTVCCRPATIPQR